MVDKMGFFDFLRFQSKKTNAIFSERWRWMKNGLVRDDLRRNQPAWIVSTNLFESWIHGIEERCDQSLGRRLAHAASQSEEALIVVNSKPNILTGISNIDWKELNQDWKNRGLGELSLLDNSDGEFRLLISYPANEAMCAGFSAAAMESCIGSRYRFRWSGTREKSVVVSFAKDEIEIPVPEQIEIKWFDEESSIIESEISNFFENESHGKISLMGNRNIILHRDLILRFVIFCEPYIQELYSGRIHQYEFSEVSDSTHLLWTAMADSLREVTFNLGHHIMISKTDDWLNVGSRYLSDYGLGSIESAFPVDANGGVEFILDGCFHPALVGGVLLSCWERAYGRQGSLQYSLKERIVHLIISSSVEISN
tara:strand:- start:10824 stop:11927 length:1104 start_codon:yes stop_codon:yes gene_type:complete